jgi:hypothetical protein
MSGYVPPHKRNQQNAGGDGDGAAVAGAVAGVQRVPMETPEGAQEHCIESRAWARTHTNLRCGQVTFRKGKSWLNDACFSCALHKAMEAGTGLTLRTEAVARIREMDRDERAQLVAENPRAIEQCQRVHVLKPIYVAAMVMNH